eukprot:CAMPEP_0114251770 /NCGR_PEP_ID=MMETSP0058-20121206/15459_1 /TAXON_ID=36894 /ORGANISM="Pyramimonas parkeae, CCMP726" /LENGTH=210 /DNA_ID=CAMNT_0001365617 /DNA_START=88 /DNA_END=720 /DNA_ORIENTATION=-
MTRRVVLITVDGSDHSEHAVAWAASHVTQPLDHVHLVTALVPDANPSTGNHSDAPRPCSPDSEVKAPENWPADARAKWEHGIAERVSQANEMLRKYADMLFAGRNRDTRIHNPYIDKDSITTQVIMDVSKVGPAVVKYAEDIKADLVVVGSRGLGSIKRKIMGLIGLGSVSDYLVHHLHCPAVVVKSQHTVLTAKNQEGVDILAEHSTTA